MALSGYEERVVANLERQFRQGDPLMQLRRRLRYRVAGECIAAIAGMPSCLLGLVLWWPAAVIAGAFVTAGTLLFILDLSRNGRWMSRDAAQRWEHHWRRLLAGAATIRRTLSL